MASDLEEEYEDYGLHPMFSNLYPDEDDQLEDEGLMDDIADYDEDDIANYKEVEYVDFLGVEDILNSPHDDYGEFYADEENYMFTRESVVDPFLSVFMAWGREKERQKNDKSEVLATSVWGVHDRHQGIPMMGSVTLILRCCLVLILRKGKWNELTGHPKDRGKDQPNSRMNSLQPRENDANQTEFWSLSVTTLDSTIERPPVLDHTNSKILYYSDC